MQEIPYHHLDQKSMSIFWNSTFRQRRSAVIINNGYCDTKKHNVVTE